ncbi:MAG TPA: type II toxin-antitoxin system RelE/ParE family toxin [Rhizomicrobium sp.]|jgi:phage-related protein
MQREPNKPLVWVGSSRDDIRNLPKLVRVSFGIRLDQLQRGKMPLNTKALPQFGSGVFELRENYDKNAYRLIYVLKLHRAVYVLHVFMKKSKAGIALPKVEANLIDVRLQRAKQLDAES